MLVVAADDAHSSARKTHHVGNVGRIIIPPALRGYGVTNLLERRWLLGVPVVGLAMMFSLALAEGADLLPAPTPPAAPPAPPAPAVMAFSRPFNCYAGIVGEVSISHPDFANTLAVNSYSESYALGRRGGGVAGCDFYRRSR